MFLPMRFLVLSTLGLFLPGAALAQTMDDLSSLPSTKAEQKMPEMGEAEAKSAFPETPSSPSIPQLRSPAQDEQKAKSQDWAAEGMKEKQEAAKKKQQEEAAQAEAKARELAAQEQTKTTQKDRDENPVVSKNSVDGLATADKGKLPTVTGIEGVKPRASESGDGRVQPGFDSFTGPSSTSPMGKDYQSGAKPIMPPSSASDGRMMVPPKPPEPPSGAYKKISQDPYALPAKSETSKPVSTAKTQPEAKNPPPGNPLSPGQPAGYSPYDNTRVVPDPRSTRRF